MGLFILVLVVFIFILAKSDPEPRLKGVDPYCACRQCEARRQLWKLAHDAWAERQRSKS